MNLRAHDQVKKKAAKSCGLRARGQVMKHHDSVLMARLECVGGRARGGGSCLPLGLLYKFHLSHQ